MCVYLHYAHTYVHTCTRMLIGMHDMWAYAHACLCTCMPMCSIICYVGLSLHFTLHIFPALRAQLQPFYTKADVVVVVTHGLTMRFVLMQLYGWSPNTFHTVWNAKNCRCVCVGRMVGKLGYAKLCTLVELHLPFFPPLSILGTAIFLKPVCAYKGPTKGWHEPL